MAKIRDVLCNELPNMASPSVRDDRKLEFLIEKEKERRRRETKKEKEETDGRVRSSLAIGNNKDKREKVERRD